MGTRDARVDAYIDKSADFARPVLAHLRALIHEACPDVSETIKWRFASFEYKGLLAGLAAFKHYCTLGFWKHELLLEQGLPKKDQEAMGQFGKVTSLDDLPSDATILKLIRAAATLNEQGVKKPVTKTVKPPPRTPVDLARALKKNGKASAAFKAFSPSHRREYIQWITEAKTPETRAKRVATTVAWSAAGKGRNWKYQR